VLLPPPQATLVGIVSSKGPPDRSGTVEIAYGIVPSQEGKGYATEAMRAFLEWICRDSRTRRIVGETHPRRVASIAVMEKCGMSFVGEGSVRGAVRYARFCRA
jgi:ribosomal-protein-alanine N-acetyltransferase